MKRKVLWIISCIPLFWGCSTSKNPEGIFSGSMGTIIIGKSQIEFVDVDEEFLRDTYAFGEAAKDYFAEYRDGIILTEEEVSQIRRQYYESFDPSLYSNTKYLFECEYNDSEYLWEYFLKDGDGDGIWSLTYYEKNEYIDFQGETFQRQ